MSLALPKLFILLEDSWMAGDHRDRTAATSRRCDIVQADHAPEAGVAQVIFHGILVKHQGKHQEEAEEGLEEEVERREEREHSSNQTQVRMHG